MEEKLDFDQPTACEAPIYRSKYTTLNLIYKYFLTSLNLVSHKVWSFFKITQMILNNAHVYQIKMF